jgi:hypothetical protein
MSEVVEFQLSGFSDLKISARLRCDVKANVCRRALREIRRCRRTLRQLYIGALN